MKAEIKVIRLHDGDVVSTSNCADAFGVINVDSDTYFGGYANGYGTRLGPKSYDQAEYTIKNYKGQRGMYHFHVSSGEIVLDGKCTSENPLTDHNVSIW